MKKYLLPLLVLLLLMISNAYSQETEEKEKTKKEKSEKKKKGDDATFFIGEPENSDDYQIEDRKEISKPLMPMYDVDQEFHKGKNKKSQQTAFSENKYYFPAKPKNAWQLGINGGVASINGDVSSNFFGAKPFAPGYTFGAYVKKPFSYMFSGRIGYKFMEMWNTDWKPTTLVDELRINGLQAYAPGSLMYNNSHTVSHEMTVDGIISFGNVRFHKERSKVVFNVIVSAGGFMYRTWMDHFDADGNPYDYRSIPNVNNPDVTKKEVLRALEDLRSGTYETKAEGHPESKNPSILGGYSFRPAFGGGFGITFRVNRWMDLDLETKMMFTRDDLVDGVRWQEPSASGGSGSRGLTRDYDSYMTTTLGMNFKLVGKKKTEPTTLLNPFHYTYAKLAESDPDRILKELTKDTDEDGVPDIFDKEPDTPKGAPVDPSGRALDSDKDGIIDLYDLEPFSPPGYPIDEFGVAQVPPPACCDGIGAGAGAICEAITELPSVHFDKDKYFIRPEFYAHMHNIAEMMLLCPDLKIVATGMTDKDDNEKYNEQLSWNRANAVIEYITAKYGVDRSRFIVEFDGKKNASGTSSIDQFRERKVGFRVAKDGETGNSNPPAPHPGLKAGSDK